jgi:hypothetical protein
MRFANRFAGVIAISLFVQSVAIGQVNVAPSFTNLNDPKSQVWSAGLTVVDPDASVTDPDSVNFAGGFLSVKVVGGLATDRLSIRSLTTVGSINVLASDVRIVTSTGFQSVGTIVGTIPVSGATLLRINLKSRATPAIVTRLLRSITYRNESATTVNALKTLRFQVSDGDGGLSTPVNKTISIISPATSEGYWTGYWTWYPSIGWKWTWVWVNPPGWTPS